MQKFKVMVRAIIILGHPDQLLLYRKKGSDIYFLPGVDIEPGKQATECLANYLREKLMISPGKFYFVGTMEHIAGTEHIYTLFFKADEFGSYLELPQTGLEVFEWKMLPLEQNVKLEPKYLKEDLSRWLKGKEIFLSTKDKAFSA
ncbi:MAG: NUDIX domain-containing protein [Patescibacteria group bacterium]